MVVDTAAGQGLVGEQALQNIEGHWASNGLAVPRVPPRNPSARGVGGGVKATHTALIPVGIEGSVGVLELDVLDQD
eukprot:4062888-Pyramimonas_sp.AAC.1